jgi:2-aminoethylphosphonate-pyruvate transaminase
MRQYTLLNPGPCNVTDAVRGALQVPDLCHREPEYFACQDEVRALLLEVFGLDAAEYAAILLTGSGTAAMEAAVSSATGPGEKMLVVNNGVYGDRLARMARAHGIDLVELVWGWMEPPDLGRVAATLDADPSIRCVAAVHHETTTGLLNPLAELGALCAERGIELLVDSTSGLAGETFDFAQVQPTYVTCTANKCIQGLPGIAFVLAKRAAVERASSFPARTVYFHLPTYLTKQDASDTPFTPAVQVLFAMRQALHELRDESVEGRIARYAGVSARIRAGLAELGVEPLLPARWHSNTITAFRLPTGWTYLRLHDALKEAGYVIYAGQGDLAKTCFRIANMGQIEPAEVERLLEVFGALLSGDA